MKDHFPRRMKDYSWVKPGHMFTYREYEFCIPLFPFFSVLCVSWSWILLPRQLFLTPCVCQTKIPDREGPWITIVPEEPNDSADPLPWLCSVSALQPCGACTPNSQHLHLVVRGLPSGCIRQLFLHVWRADIALEFIPSSQPPATDGQIWEYKYPSSLDPGGIVCDVTCLSPKPLYGIVTSYLCRALFDMPNLFVLLSFPVPYPHYSSFFLGIFLSQKSRDSKTNSRFYMHIVSIGELSHKSSKFWFWGAYVRRGHFIFC